MCGVVYIFSKSSWLSCAFSVRQLMRSGPFVSIFRNTSPVRIDRKELPGADKAGVGSWGWCTRSNFDGGGGVSSIPQETCKAGCNLKADNRLMTKIPREICIPSTIPLTCFYQLRRELCSSLCITADGMDHRVAWGIEPLATDGGRWKSWKRIVSWKITRLQ